MNNSTDDQPSRSKSWLPMLLMAVVAIGAGIFAGNVQFGDKSEESHSAHSQEDIDALAAVQEKMLNTTLFMDDFKSVPAFSLLHGNDEALTDANLKDKWTVLFFGFTHCPDICPITLSEMNGAAALLKEQGVEVPQVIFITVDPNRDSVTKMNEYVAYFNKDFIGASGDLADITALTRHLGVVASYTAGSSNDGTYTVDHTASMLVIDPSLRVRAKLNAPHKADTIAADLQTLLSEFN